MCDKAFANWKNSAYCVSVCKSIEKGMTLNVRIAYGFNRSDRDFRTLDITGAKYFIDNDKTDREELRSVLVACREGVTVVVLQVSDFGPGAKAKQIVKEIEATGATVEVAEKPVAKRGAPLKGEMSEADEKWAKALWLDKSRTKTVVLERINERTGQQFTRDQLNYRFIGRAKRKKS